MSTQRAKPKPEANGVHAGKDDVGHSPETLSGRDGAAGSIRPMPHADPVRAARAAGDLPTLDAAISDCFACPRLVAWREEQARVKVARFRDETYWARPVPGFGDPTARILLVGLAPAAHGGNRTGRVFTGDASGDFLWRAMHAAGVADRPTSRRAGDGLKLIGTRVAAAVRCAPPANKPTIEEQATCRPYLVREIELLLGASGRRRARRHRVGRVPQGARGGRPPDPSPEAPVRARRRGRDRPLHARRYLPPEPAEHVHGPPDAADAPSGPRACRRVGLDVKPGMRR